MTDSNVENIHTAATGRSGRGGGLNAKLLPELKQIAGGLGIKATGLKKADLIVAIKAAQSGAQSGAENGGEENRGNRNRQRKRGQSEDQNRGEGSPKQTQPEHGRPEQDKPEQDKPEQVRPEQNQPKRKGSEQKSPEKASSTRSTEAGRDQEPREPKDGDKSQQGNQGDNEDGGSRRNRRRRGRDRNVAQAGAQGHQGNQSGQGNQGNQGNQAGGRNRNEPDLTVLEDDVLAPAAGILDVLDNYAFVRTSGYLPSDDDVYVSMSMVRKFGLRRGDAIIGQVRQPREGERREKFNPLVQLDSVNGAAPEASKDRAEFASLTPTHPTERLRLEAGPDDPSGRVIDLVAPVGKGQRGLIVAPAETGATTLLRSIATATTSNNPEVHLMVVLIDQRPEEVTDFQRAVRGEVISSTIDRPVLDHTTVAELAIERAERLVEMGHDVVLLLDGLTRLGRAYNLVAPASGRALGGGVDAASINPTRKILGAARNIEDGGSLTVVATAAGGDPGVTVMDEVFLDSFRGVANSELRLSRVLADELVVPAIDVVASGTRQQQALMGDDEMAIVRKLERMLCSGQGEHPISRLLGLIGETRNNIELLTKIKSASN